ncbi:MAG: DUF805 domain-containing protein [Rhodospirillales bacterium]|nr:DUF805 domain-containing protein [Rhodospirillales bacterium]
MTDSDIAKLEQLSTLLGLGGGLVFIIILGIVLLVARRDMTGWNLPVKYVWFNLSGRINRKTYWLTGIVGMALLQAIYEFVIGTTMFGVTRLITLPPAAEGILLIAVIVTMVPLMVFVIWASLAINFKRAHDRDRSGWFLLIGLIPLIGAIWLLVELGFLKGTQGTNRFGPEQSDTASNAPGSQEQSKRTIPTRIIEETPSSNLSDQPKSEIIAARLGTDFLNSGAAREPDEPNEPSQDTT